MPEPNPLVGVLYCLAQQCSDITASYTACASAWFSYCPHCHPLNVLGGYLCLPMFLAGHLQPYYPANLPFGRLQIGGLWSVWWGHHPPGPPLLTVMFWCTTGVYAASQSSRQQLCRASEHSRSRSISPGGGPLHAAFSRCFAILCCMSQFSLSFTHCNFRSSGVWAGSPGSTHPSPATEHPSG